MNRNKLIISLSIAELAGYGVAALLYMADAISLNVFMGIFIAIALVTGILMVAGINKIKRNEQQENDKTL